MRALLASCLAIVALLGLGGCSPSRLRSRSDDAQPQLNILGSAEEEYVRGMARAFELETGIRTSYERLSAGDALERVRATRDAPSFSVWWGGSADTYIAADTEGLLDPYVPTGSMKIPQRFKHQSGHWTGVYVGVLGFAVNDRVLEERALPAPRTWADLVQPAYRGEVAVAHPATSGTAYTALATVTQVHGKDLNQGLAYFGALHENIRQYPRAGSEPARLAARGEVAVGIAFSHDIVRAIKEGAADVRVEYPSEGTGYEIGAMALIKNAPNPVEAKLFMDWALRERAQEMGPLFSAYQVPTNPDAKVPQESVRLASIKLIDYDFRWAAEDRETLLRSFAQQIARPPS
jgi:iron(III) transport system substrate-binding protein